MNNRPLWELLLITKDDKVLEKRPLTCIECFTILEYLADLTSNSNQNHIKQVVKEHLSTCPNCRAYYLQKLAELEDIEAEN